MKCLSHISLLTIVVKEPMVIRTCRKCGFTITENSKRVSNLRQEEWLKVFAPLIANIHCRISVFDHNMQLLYHSSPQKHEPNTSID